MCPAAEPNYIQRTQKPSIPSIFTLNMSHDACYQCKRKLAATPQILRRKRAGGGKENLPCHFCKLSTRGIA